MNREQIPDDLIHASFFFIDIVGLSNPILSTETQRSKIRVLNESIYSCNTFHSTPKEDLFILPTGDGMLIGFKDGLEQPINLAIEIHEKLRNYNLKVPSTEKIVTRIGCNVGDIFVVKDIFGNVNLWGPGAILARRVMDLGDEDHILLTASMAEDLIEISEKYNQILHPIHDYNIKHSEEILVYTAYGQNFGNQNPPKKTNERIKTTDVKENTKCEKVVFNVMIKDLKTGLVRHERNYYFVNNFVEPIYNISVGITTNKENEFLDLGIFDGNEKLKMSKISSLSPFSKEVMVKLTRPIFNGESGRRIKVYYEVQESGHFENLFLNDASNFELNFVIPSNASKIAPRLYYINFKNHSKETIEESKRVTKGMSTTIQWQKSDGINSKDMIRLEWL
ncbi:MAG: adenylate/guanylate cyclase domain-containing protein [Candidatus Nitrosotenuis sp.]